MSPTRSSSSPTGMSPTRKRSSSPSLDSNCCSQEAVMLAHSQPSNGQDLGPVLVGSAPLVTHSSGCPSTSNATSSSSNSGPKSTPVSTPCSPCPPMMTRSQESSCSPFAHHSYDLRRKCGVGTSTSTISDNNCNQTAQQLNTPSQSLYHIQPTPSPPSQLSSSIPHIALSVPPRKKAKKNVTPCQTTSSSLDCKF